jgi:Tol biopolymer transport system component
MSKIYSTGISIFILLILISGANAIAVENVKKNDVSKTDFWDVVLSPDGTQIAFVANDEKNSQQIFVINTDGSGEKKLTNDANKKWGLAWGKEKMAYISYGNVLEKIFVINPDGTGNTQLIPDNTRQGNYERYMVIWGAPSWSPDGSLLAYTSLDEKENPKIYVVNADGTNKRLVIEDSFKQWSPSFSPDSKSIVYVSYPETKNKEELFTVEISGIARKQLTFDEIKKNYPVWGPEGTIVFVSYENVMSSGEKLFAIDQDGKNRRLFINTDHKQRSPSFSLDGRKFAYAAIDVSGIIKIAVGDVTGITGTPSPTTPVPDGKTPVSTLTVQETAGEKKEPMPSVSIVPVIAVMFLLAMLMRKNNFKK